MVNNKKVASRRNQLSSAKGKLIKYRRNKLFEEINFKEIDSVAKSFAEHIEKNFEKITEILLKYESFEVVKDEINRAQDLLTNLNENKKYFRIRVGSVTSFLPRNQPIYALTCFVLVPSLMSTSVHFRIPHSMRHFFPELLRILNLKFFFPNVIISGKQRKNFLYERSALYINPKTKDSWPVTDVVIFTGIPNHADQLRLLFDSRTLFITNGSGHNPVVISNDSNISDAIEATLSLQLYNQGQDCAAPNAILVHKDVFKLYMKELRKKIQEVRVGFYKDKSCRVGPISEPSDLVRIQNILVENHTWIDPATPGVIRANDLIVEPTIINKPLKKGGNFNELFSPIIFVQKYDNDKDLFLFFESSQYPRNAMYVTLFGTSKYVNNLIGKKFEGKILHDRSSIIINTHLHADGIERGVQPYGGYGYGASNLSINGKIICKPTLPQRDIYEWVMKPFLREKKHRDAVDSLQKKKKIIHKDTNKILNVKMPEKIEKQINQEAQEIYIDSHIIKGEGRRYFRVHASYTYQLLEEPNIKYIASLLPRDREQIKILREYLSAHTMIPMDQFSNKLYSIPIKLKDSPWQNRKYQLQFFKHIYQLLLGKESGPRLVSFLLDIDRLKACELLNA